MPTRRKLGTASRNRRLKKRDFKIELESHVAREVGAIIYFGLAIIFYLIIFGRAGMLGNVLDDYLRVIFGVGIYILPILFLGFAVTMFFSHRIRFDAARYLGIGLLIFAGLGLVHMRTPVDDMLSDVEQFGGYVGFLASVLLRIFISDIGAKVVLIAAFLIGILITFEVSFKDIISFILPDRKIKIETKMTPNRKAPLLNRGEGELNIVKPLLSKEKTEEKKEEVKKKEHEDKIFKPIEIN